MIIIIDVSDVVLPDLLPMSVFALVIPTPTFFGYLSSYSLYSPAVCKCLSSYSLYPPAFFGCVPAHIVTLRGLFRCLSSYSLYPQSIPWFFFVLSVLSGPAYFWCLSSHSLHSPAFFRGSVFVLVISN